MKKSNEEIENISMRYSVIVYILVSLVIIATDKINGIFCPQHLIAFLSFLIVGRAINYVYTKKIRHLMWIVVFFIALIGTLIEYVSILL